MKPEIRKKSSFIYILYQTGMIIYIYLYIFNYVCEYLRFLTNTPVQNYGNLFTSSHVFQHLEMAKFSYKLSDYFQISTVFVLMCKQIYPPLSNCQFLIFIILPLMCLSLYVRTLIFLFVSVLKCLEGPGRYDCGMTLQCFYLNGLNNCKTYSKSIRVSLIIRFYLTNANYQDYAWIIRNINDVKELVVS